MTIRITLKDGAVLEAPDAANDLSQTLALERHFGNSEAASVRLVETGLFTMWYGLRRIGAKVPDDLDEFVSQIASVKTVKSNGNSGKGRKPVARLLEAAPE